VRDDVVAAIDCGTNSTRLLVARTDGDDRLETLERLMVVTRLGQGVDATGRLDPDAITRTVDVLRRYKDVLERHGATRIRMAATSAARDAENRDDFFDAAEAVVGVRP
jgi:exopolyphosphatase/guanosine-5'-triphosphate,3'-diphosphate pyrophosphatase